uniref:Uncharacterized protein n=1 Tax=Romanomermis culicivorax TaxID=13658 RepID=A0A915KDB2_ROMCU
MPVETYVEVMEKLTNDFRFRIYTALYRRLIVFWFIFCLFVLLMLLLSGLKGITLFSIVLLWLFLTGVGVLLVLHVKRILNRNLHKCVASVNKLLIKYNLMIGIEDRGKLSCHKIALIFVYFDWKSCAQKISIMSHNFQRNNARNSGLPSLSAQISPPGDTLQYGGNLSEEEKSLLLICKCSQGYVKGLSRKILRLPSTPRTPGADARQTPLHCTHSQCLCQYVQSSYFEKVRRSVVQRIFLTDGVDWSASYYVDPGFHPGILP